MPQRVKSLEDRVADRTFEARRQHHRALLELAPLVSDKALRAIQVRYRRTLAAPKRIDLAREFERTVNGNDDRDETAAEDLELELAKLGPPRSAKRAIAFFPRFLTLEDGSKFRTQTWQRDVLVEYHRRIEEENRRMYKQFLLGIGRGNGKTPFSTGLGVLEVCENPFPRVFQAAGSKEQARVGTEFAGAWIEDGDLARWLIAKAGAVEPRFKRGFYRIAGADGRMLHGRKPTRPLLDEWWLLESLREQQIYVAMVTALQKEPEACLFAASTAGYNKDTQLGRVYEEALQLPDIEYRREGFLRICRDVDNGFCMWWYGMPEGYELDLEDDRAVLRALKLANPSTFVDTAALLRLLRSPGCDVYEWLRLHLNHWTATRDSWLPLGCFAGLRAHQPIPDGAEIWVAVDAASKRDTTAVVWAAHIDGVILMQGRAWAARDSAPAHVRHDGGRIRNREVMEWIDRELGSRYRVREIVADPRFFDDYIWELGQRGYLVAEFVQSSKEMRDAEQHFFQRATANDPKELAWYDPDGIFSLHVDAMSAKSTRTGFKVDNPDKSRPIDLGTAAIMASERAAIADRRPVSVYEKRGITVLGASPAAVDEEHALPEDPERSEALPYSDALARLLGLPVSHEDELDDEELDDVGDLESDDL